MATVAVCWRNFKIVPLRGHARDDVLGPRAAHVRVIVALIETIRFILASKQVFGFALIR